ncbi:DUF192 domain-containing protein [Candidatus Daviesbacteria bacterium]|nr:DUF192 domain-containing protein [Candidatus Daviesbacteria bacterium]
MKKFAIQAVLLLIVIALALVFFGPTAKVSKIELPFLPKPAIFTKLQIKGVNLRVEIADSQPKRSKGLGGRSSLGQNEGMLFIFPKADKYQFWMKGLIFPLDLIYIKDEKIVEILSSVQPPAAGQTDASLPIYQPQEEINMVLEVNAGTVLRLNIQPGDTIKLLP